MLIGRPLKFALATVLLLLGLGMLISRNGRMGSTVRPEMTGPIQRSNSSSGQSVRTSVERRPSAPAFPSRGRGEDQWSRRWQVMMSEARTTARDEDMVTFIEELAAVDPWRAISLAQSEGDSELQMRLSEAALRGWGGADPESALEWAASQTLLDSGQAMAAVFHGVARDPEAALQFTARCSERDPERMHDYGAYLVAALSRVGEFELAAAFAAKGPPDMRLDWLNAAYSRWADSEPRAALKQISQLTDTQVRRTAFDAAISHWSEKEPRAAAEYSLTFHEPYDRAFALSVALRHWAAADPTEAATWMGHFEPSRDFDMGAAAVASQAGSS